MAAPNTGYAAARLDQLESATRALMSRLEKVERRAMLDLERDINMRAVSLNAHRIAFQNYAGGPVVQPHPAVHPLIRPAAPAPGSVAAAPAAYAGPQGRVIAPIPVPMVPQVPQVHQVPGHGGVPTSPRRRSTGRHPYGYAAQDGVKLIANYLASDKFARTGGKINWQPFAREYPVRSNRAWASFYQHYAQAIEDRVKAIRARK